MKRCHLRILAGLFIVLTGSAYSSEQAVVVAPVADVWSQVPSPSGKRADDKRETQLLFGEQVVVKKIQGTWARIEAVDQPEFTRHQKWEGYPGWVLAEAIRVDAVLKEPVAIVVSSWTATMEPETLPDVWLTWGSFIRPIGKTDYLFVVTTPLGDRCVNIMSTRSLAPLPSYALRHKILMAADKMREVPYLWGGLTVGGPQPQPLIDKTLKYGVDCSGVVHLSYRVNGVTIPRDAQEQWMKAARIKRNELLPADLIFSAAADTPKQMVHVALYDGNGQLIEAPGAGLGVRKIPFKEKYGKDLVSVESGDRVGERRVYFGRLIPD